MKLKTKFQSKSVFHFFFRNSVLIPETHILATTTTLEFRTVSIEPLTTTTSSDMAYVPQIGRSDWGSPLVRSKLKGTADLFCLAWPLLFPTSLARLLWDSLGWSAKHRAQRSPSFWVCFFRISVFYIFWLDLCLPAPPSFFYLRNCTIITDWRGILSELFFVLFFSYCTRKKDFYCLRAESNNTISPSPLVTNIGRC